jgi:hypothetical protein
MKSVIRALLTAALLCALTVFSAVAVAQVTGADSRAVKYVIDELDMTIDFPPDLIVFTRTVDPDDPNLEVFNLKKEWIEDLFLKNNIYLNAISARITYEYYVTSSAGPELEAVDDFCRSTDAYLQSFIDSEELWKKSGHTYIQAEIYRNDRTAYIKSYSEYSDGEPRYCLSYYTVINGRAIDISLYSYDKAVTPEREAILASAVDSASYPGLPVPSDHVTDPSESPTTPTSPNLSPSPSASLSPASSPDDAPSTVVIPSNPSASAGPAQTPVTPTGTPDADNISLLGLILVYLGVTLAIVTLPVAVYRYIIRREPVSKKSAVLIALIYGAVACIAAAVYIYFTRHIYLIGGVILWSFVNFLVLSRGRMRYIPPPIEATSVTAPHKRDKTTASPDMVISKSCPKCLAVNLAESEVCFYCGAKLEDDENPVR